APTGSGCGGARRHEARTLQVLKRGVEDSCGGVLHSKVTHARDIRSNNPGPDNELVLIDLELKFLAITEREANSGFHEETARRDIDHANFGPPGRFKVFQ